MANSALNLVMPSAEQEQRRQYDTAALRAALADYPARISPSLSAENEQRRQYDVSALRAALADYPGRISPALTAENEQRRQYDTPALRAALADAPPSLEETVPTVRSSHRSSRHSRRPTSYFNSFQTSCSTSTDAPPSYAQATRLRATGSLCHSYVEKLPDYSCSVFAEAKLHLCVESHNPLSDATVGEWKEVSVTVRGTMLSIYRLKDGEAGRLMCTYTLQHAEVGLAPDVEHTVLVPKTRFAHFIPTGARRRAWQKDHDMFKPVQQTIIRLRAETEQLLLSGPEEEEIHAFMFAIGSAIDIAQPIDDRSIPRQCTVPRRRRRPRPQSDSDLTSPALLAEQERILQSMYPGLAAERRSDPPETSTDLQQTPVREEDEVDVALLREDEATVRPATLRRTTTSTIGSAFSGDMIYATSPSNFDLNGKWSPSHLRSPAQIQRYLRRCLPLLLADSPRASDIIICGGKRVKVNWRMELLEDWELQPPSYKSHNFPIGPSLFRTQSQSSANEPANQQSPGSSHSVTSNEQHDEITPIGSGLETLQLTKVTSTPDKRASHPSSLPAGNGGLKKSQDPRELAQEIPTVVLCF